MTSSTEKYSAGDDTARPIGAENASSDADFDDIETGAVNEKKLLAKLDLRLLPGVAVLYLLSFLDRSNGKCQQMIFENWRCNDKNTNVWS